jgi:hypothetical protein
MSIRNIAAAAAFACAGFAAHAAPNLFNTPMTQDDVKAQKVRIEDQYSTARQRCSRVQGTARELCNEQARGERDVQQAELVMQVEPSADHDQQVRLAKANAAYAVALVKCKDFDGEARAVCRQDAKSTLADAKEDARLQKEVVAQELSSELTVRDRTVAAEKAAEAQYQAARQRCDLLPGEGRANCLADARKRFGRD